jgi:serine/threonine-protein kinase
MSRMERVETQPPGKLLGNRYQILMRLGEGGMGAVYAAEDVRTHDRVAIKVLSKDNATADENAELVARFLREVEATGKIHHPNIVRVSDQGKDKDGTLYMVQELMTGEVLRARLQKRGRLSLPRVLDIALPLMGGLAAAHAQGVIHRDIKPENIFLVEVKDHPPLPKLFDFGISKFNDPTVQRTALTAAGVTLGTPQYMSPEQLMGRADLDGRSDMWSVGVVLYEMLAGDLPFNAAAFGEVALKVMTGKPRPLVELCPELSADVVAIIERVLTTERDRRYASMEELIAAMLDCPGVRAALKTPPEERYRDSLPETLRGPRGAAPASAPAATPTTPAAKVAKVAPAAPQPEPPGAATTEKIAAVADSKGSTTRLWLMLAAVGLLAVAALVLALSR